MFINNIQQPIAFLADCHLPLITRPEQEVWVERVVEFLRAPMASVRTLVLAGDLFDFWFEWRYSVPEAAFPVLAELYALRRKGVHIIYLAGNHDGHPGRFMEKRLGLTVSREAVDLETDGLHVHVAHGDGVAPADRAYRLLRRLVRWKFTEWVYRNLVHPDWGIWFAHRVSRFSGRYTSQKDAFGPEPYRDYARAKLATGCDIVVMGHRHAVDVVEHDRGGYFAIGDWIRSGSYGWLENGRMEVRFFRGGKGT